MPSQNTVRSLASMLGLARAGIGVAAVVAPQAAVGGWAGKGVDNAGGSLLARAFGARDAALGLGVLLAARRGAPLKTWLRLSGLCDIVDAAATRAAGDEAGAMAPLSMALATTGAASSFALAAWADE
jgi:hypothetical protein